MKDLNVHKAEHVPSMDKYKCLSLFIDLSYHWKIRDSRDPSGNKKEKVTKVDELRQLSGNKETCKDLSTISPIKPSKYFLTLSKFSLFLVLLFENQSGFLWSLKKVTSSNEARMITVKCKGSYSRSAERSDLLFQWKLKENSLIGKISHKILL